MFRVSFKGVVFSFDIPAKIAKKDQLKAEAVNPIDGTKLAQYAKIEIKSYGGNLYYPDLKKKKVSKNDVQSLKKIINSYRSHCKVGHVSDSAIPQNGS